MVRFIHTADWQLGKAFRDVGGDKGARLRRQRIEAVGSLRDIAREQDAQFVLLAGDMFDGHQIGSDVIAESCEAIKAIALPVYVIPGNHDFAGSIESVFQRQRWVRSCPDNLHLLTDCEPVIVPDTNAIIFPCPLMQRHVHRDPTSHLDRESGREAGGERIRIGLAHGSVHGFDSEADGTVSDLIDPGVVDRAELDYLALGDWHGTKQISEKCWYSGTPEPDRFKDNNPGNVLFVSIGSSGVTPEVKVVPTARTRWLMHQVSVHGKEDLDALEAWFDQIEHKDHTRVRLAFDGVLGIKDQTRLDDILAHNRDHLLDLRERGEGVRLKPSEEELDSMSSEGFSGAALSQLREIAELGNDEAPAADVAIQLLYKLTHDIADAVEGET